MPALIATLNEFFRLCDAGGDALRVRAATRPTRYADARRELLKDGPVTITFPDGSAISSSTRTSLSLTLGPMYDSLQLGGLRRRPGLPRGAGRRPARRRPARHAFQALPRRPGYITKRGFPTYPNFLEGFPAVACADADNPDSYSAGRRRRRRR